MQVVKIAGSRALSDADLCISPRNMYSCVLRFGARRFVCFLFFFWLRPFWCGCMSSIVGVWTEH